MFEPERKDSALVYLTCLLGCLVVAIAFPTYGLLLLAILGVQYCALFWCKCSSGREALEASVQVHTSRTCPLPASRATRHASGVTRAHARPLRYAAMCCDVLRCAALRWLPPPPPAHRRSIAHPTQPPPSPPLLPLSTAWLLLVVACTRTRTRAHSHSHSPSHSPTHQHIHARAHAHTHTHPPPLGLQTGSRSCRSGGRCSASASASARTSPTRRSWRRTNH
jgi:hypothetical protein